MLDVHFSKQPRMDSLPQRVNAPNRIAKRLGQNSEMIRDHLAKKAELPNPPNADLTMGWTDPNERPSRH